MTRKKKGSNLEYYWCPTLKTTSWDKKMPCDVDVHKITDNKSGGGKKEEEELRKNMRMGFEDKKFQEKMNLASFGMFPSSPKKKENKDLVQKLKNFTLFNSKKSDKPEKPTIKKTMKEYNENLELDDLYAPSNNPEYREGKTKTLYGGKRKKLMCPKNCCGLPVQKCGCPVSCKHCNCPEIKKLRKKLSRCRKKKKTRRKRKKTRRKRKKKRRKKKTRR